MGASWQDYAFAPFGAVGLAGAAMDDKSNGSGAFANGIGGALGGLKNTLEGDPASLVNALHGLMSTAYQRGDETKNFLLGREGNAEQYYRPMQQMFGQMYGSAGMMPPKAPSVPGVNPIGGR